MSRPPRLTRYESITLGSTTSVVSRTVGAVTRTRLAEWILPGLSLGLSSGAFRVLRRSRRSLNRHHSEHRYSDVPRQVKLEIVLGVTTLAGSDGSTHLRHGTLLDTRGQQASTEMP
jgi:hypothetical protein